ncbi:hypothetical protein [Deinococcus peraridilitoris]|uniref:Lipoprotein n=1 Tax=Deinococcus peraridilitoris (strain DSM 19664 / LMG 22246 / CIP 109416 / KR-200) TaxID=937777 RepID=L0A6F2_DEIPD|nr:hypothetical protein [Deinococcus peraridilitoris]AFZ69463.1 hypothetical protein Deipe_4087 [Deinococcus peraridilitoris DSM 19664]
MKRIVLAGCLILTLSACRPSYEPGSYRVTFSEEQVSIVRPADSVLFVSEVANPNVQADVVGAQFKIGNRIYPGTRQDVNSSEFVYQWLTSNSCKDLPQGSNVTATYEMLNAAQQVVQSKSINIKVIDTCR